MASKKPKRKPSIKLHPVERALAKSRWDSLVLNAELHLASVSDMSKMIDSTLTLLYIVGLAAHRSGITTPEARIIAGSCRTALDCLAAEAITPQQMATLESGLAAAKRLKPLLKEELFVEASIQASIIIKSRGVYWSDFEEFLPPKR